MTVDSVTVDSVTVALVVALLSDTRRVDRVCVCVMSSSDVTS